MRVLSSAIFSIVCAFGVSHAMATGSLDKSLMKLEPVERAQQACVIKGLDALRRSDKRLAKADRLMPDTFKRPHFDGSVVTAKGAAVHASKQWYALSFECTVSDDQMKALAFTFKVGDAIPPERWEDVGLWR